MEQLKEDTAFNHLARTVGILFQNNEHVAGVGVHHWPVVSYEVLKLLVVDVVGQPVNLLLQIGVLGAS